MPGFGALPAASVAGGEALGPVGIDGAPSAGWVVDHAIHHAPQMVDGALRVAGNSRLYLVHDHTKKAWEEHQYIRLDLSASPLTFTLDLSKVPCGCLACVYLVAMPDPSLGANYCDMVCDGAVSVTSNSFVRTPDCR